MTSPGISRGCRLDLGHRVPPTSARAPRARRCRRSWPSNLRVLYHRYYDPSTDQFLSVDPLVSETGNPYAFTNGDPVNAIDPNGLDCGVFSFACAAYDSTAGAVKATAKAVVHHPLEAIAIVGSGIATVATDGATSELLVESISVATSEDATTVVVEGTIVESPAETSALGQIAGGVGQLSSISQTALDCAKRVNATCFLEAGTTAVGLGSQFFSGLTDMGKALAGLGTSLLPPFFPTSGSTEREPLASAC